MIKHFIHCLKALLSTSGDYILQITLMSNQQPFSDSEESLYHDPVTVDDHSHPPTPVRDSPLSVSSASSIAERIASLQEARKSNSSVTTNPDGTIPNRPPSAPHDHEEEAAEKALSAELVSGEELSARQIELVVKAALYDLFIVTPLLLAPSVLLFLFAKFEVYWPYALKGRVAGTNTCMEFIRYNTFAAMAFALLVVADVCSLIVPESVLITTEGAKMKSMYYIRRQMRALISIRSYVSMAAWLLSLVPLGGVWLYESSLMTPFSLLSNIVSAEVKKVDKTQLKEAIDIAKSLVFHKQLESLLLATAVFAMIVACEKYLIEIIRLNFHKNAFSERIVENNTKFVILGRLYEAITKGKPRILARGALNRHHEMLDQSYEQIMHLNSLHRAKSIARTLFRSLAAPDRDYLLPEDFEQWIAESNAAFAVFDPERLGKITGTQMEAAVIEIYEHRVNLLDSMIGNSRVINKLDMIFLTCALIIGVSITTPVFDLGISKILSAVAVLTTSLAFIFHPAAKSFFEALIFVFVQHAFDVGDRVLIDDESYIVENVDLMNTRMSRWDGVTVYIPNSSLSSKIILNVRRSGDQFERVSLSLKSSLTTDSLWKFRAILQAKLAESTAHFTGHVDIVDFDKISADGTNLTLGVVAQVRGNFQNLTRRNVIKTELLSKIESSLNEAQIIRA